MHAYTDIDLTLSKQRDGDIKTLIDIEAVKANIINVVKTIPGSRRMNPEFSFGPHNFLFDQITEHRAISLGEALKEVIEFYEDRIILENIHVVGNTREGTYNIKISFKLKEYGPSSEVYNFSFILKRL